MAPIGEGCGTASSAHPWGGFGGRGQRIANTIFPRRRALLHSAAAWPAASRLVLCQNSAFGRGRMQATESQESILASDEPSKTPPPRIRFSVALVSLCTLVCGPGANRPKHVYRRVTTRKERVVQLPRAGPQRTGRAYNRRCRSARVTGQTSQRCLQRERRKN